MRLDELPTGRTARVVRVSDEGGHWRKLMAFGIRAGTVLRVDQRFPSLVVQVGHTRVALDFSAAALVEIEPTS
ncbi:MAG: ferrous iron transport protein A [Fimbriimonadia bacterium]|jgi:Fe2+ transport system protein FeoA